MGAIGGMLGLGGGSGGSGFQAPQNVNIMQPVTAKQADKAYADQQNLIGSLQGQGGAQNQSSIFNQLQSIASGQGPNPAQAMLNQQTGQNVANQAALMAGQRGASANSGLMARQAAMQGGNLQQQAVGQGATMQAQQSLNALTGAGNIAGQQVANQMGAVNSQQANLLNAIGQQNNANVAMQSNINSANSAMANTRMGQQPGMIGGILGGIGSAIGLSRGGAVGYADGGNVGPTSSFGQFISQVNAPEPMQPEPVQGAAPVASDGGNPIKDGVSSLLGALSSAGGGGAGAAPTGVGGMMSGAAMKSGGMVPVALSPGEKVVSPGKVSKAASGKIEAKTVPGKASVSGDSVKNDTYKTRLEPGSIVIPRTSAGNERDAASFVRNVLAKRGRK